MELVFAKDKKKANIVKQQNSNNCKYYRTEDVVKLNLRKEKHK